MDMNESNSKVGDAFNKSVGRVHLNHGGHEVNDIREILNMCVNLLNQFIIYYQYIADQELKDILQRQYAFMTDDYNMLAQSFSTGQDPDHGTKRYQMKENSTNIIYGLTPSSPKMPNKSIMETNDQNISGFMLSGMKSIVSQKSIAALEVSNPVVRRVLADSIPNCIEMCYETALWQNKHGYYSIPQYSETDMSTIIHSYSPTSTAPDWPQSQIH